MRVESRFLGGWVQGEIASCHSIGIDFSYAGRMNSKELIYIMAIVNKTISRT